LANIALGVSLAAVALVGDVGRSAFLAPLVFLLVGMFMGLHGLVWLLPWRPDGVPSYGKRLFSLVTGSPSGRRWIALKTIASLSDSGVRPREWPSDVVNDLVQASDGSTDDVGAALTLYWYLLDSRRLTEARSCLEQARAAASQYYMSQLNGQLVLLELAFIEARTGEDPAVAVSNLVRSAFFAPAMLARVVAAVQLSYADFAAAEKTADNALRDFSSLRPGFALMEADLLRELADEARQRRVGGVQLEAAAPRERSAVDVSRFAVPDMDLKAPLPPPGVRSLRTLVASS
jgi:hypothetical protein